jgi:carboxypeptidase T
MPTATYPRRPDREAPGGRRSHPRRVAGVVLLAAAGGLLFGPTGAGAAPEPSRPEPAVGAAAAAEYVVHGPRTWDDADAVAGTGAAVDYIEHGKLHVSATPAEVRAITRLGFEVEQEIPAPAHAHGHGDGDEVGALDFPEADARYHDCAEMIAEVDRVVATHPAIAQKVVLGKSYEGRDIVAVKISDNVGVEPEVLYTLSSTPVSTSARRWRST